MTNTDIQFANTDISVSVLAKYITNIYISPTLIDTTVVFLLRLKFTLIDNKRCHFFNGTEPFLLMKIMFTIRHDFKIHEAT